MAVVSLRVVAVWILSRIKQQPHNVIFSMLRSQRQRPMSLLGRGSGQQLPGRGNSSQSGCRGEVFYSCAAPDECFGGAAKAKRQRGHQRGRPLAGATRLHVSAEIHQRFNERDLQSRFRRRAARHQHTQRRAAPTVHVRDGVCFGAGLEQHSRNVHRVRRRPLPVPFDAIRRDVMQQGGAMDGRIERCHARRTGAHELRLLGKQPGEGGNIAVDHGFDCRFEYRDGRRIASHGVNMLCEAGPTLEVVPAGDCQLRVLELERDTSKFLV
jgi:hypothetical protein